MNLKRSLAAPTFAFSLCFMAAACGGDDKSAAPTPTPSVSESSPCVLGALTLVAKDIDFDKSCLIAPANQPITITMDNKDAGIPHNFAIYPDLRSSAALFKGENVLGPVVKAYKVPALAAGEYHFRCDIHPRQMQGDFVVE
ncbi:MAG: cupredoxin domain-containing protein [Actinomycetota bacterium]